MALLSFRKQKTIFQVIAHDNSCGSHPNNNNNNNNNKVHYSFKESSDNEIFKLDSLTGKICLQKSLDYENVSRYQLTVFATNSGNYYFLLNFEKNYFAEQIQILM